jgi:hypothetical protein
MGTTKRRRTVCSPRGSTTGRRGCITTGIGPTALAPQGSLRQIPRATRPGSIAICMSWRIQCFGPIPGVWIRAISTQSAPHVHPTLVQSARWAAPTRLRNLAVGEFAGMTALDQRDTSTPLRKNTQAVRQPAHSPVPSIRRIPILMVRLRLLPCVELAPGVPEVSGALRSCNVQEAPIASRVGDRHTLIEGQSGTPAEVLLWGATIRRGTRHAHGIDGLSDDIGRLATSHAIPLQGAPHKGPIRSS